MTQTKVETFTELRAKAAKKLGKPADSLIFYSYPQTFLNTSGPHNGIGGQAFWNYQVYVFLSPLDGRAWFCCAGVERIVDLRGGGLKVEGYFGDDGISILKIWDEVNARE